MRHAEERCERVVKGQKGRALCGGTQPKPRSGYGVICVMISSDSTCRRQYLIPPYIVDFACISARLIVEADGGQHNKNRRDVARDAFLRRKDWRVLRFWNNDIHENIDGVMESVAEALGVAPPPQPSPAGGGGRDPRQREGGGA